MTTTPPINELRTPGGKLKAREATEPINLDTNEIEGTRMYRFTAVISWADDPDGTEEIDVDAADKPWGRKMVKAILDRDYEPGGKITEFFLS